MSDPRKTEDGPGMALRSGELVGMRLSLTPAERELLLAMVRQSANDPADIDYAVNVTLCAKVERALAHPNQ